MDVCIERFGVTYRVGDKVMQTDNDYDKDVFNGDVGYVRRIDLDAQTLVIEFDDRPVEYQFGELDEVALAYAVSIHKSQGSEYPAVVMPMMMQHYMMLRRNLLYTGITRGRKLVVLVGQKQAVGMAVKGDGRDATVVKIGGVDGLVTLSTTRLAAQYGGGFPERASTNKTVRMQLDRAVRVDSQIASVGHLVSARVGSYTPPCAKMDRSVTACEREN